MSQENIDIIFTESIDTKTKTTQELVLENNLNIEINTNTNILTMQEMTVFFDKRL